MAEHRDTGSTLDAADPGPVLPASHQAAEHVMHGGGDPSDPGDHAHHGDGHGHAGQAIGAGTHVAIASAGVILAGDDPRTVLSVIALSRATYRKMLQNLWWAAGYNLLSVPLAAGLLAPLGITLPMEVGALLMSVSTIVVALNAQLLRRTDLRPERLVAS